MRHFNYALFYSANIIPEPENGIGKWTKDKFIIRFKHYSSEDVKNIGIDPISFNSVML